MPSVWSASLELAVLHFHYRLRGNQLICDYPPVGEYQRVVHCV